MNKDKLFADIYIHLHPDGLHDKKDKVEKELRSSGGVYAVHFDTNINRHALFVSYNPNAASAEGLLDIIRKSYKRAVRVASILMTVRSQSQ